MTKPKYKVGDRVTTNGLPIEIIKVNYNPNGRITYLIGFVEIPKVELIREDQIDE